MPQLILYLLLGIFFVLNALAKCLVKVTQSSNSYIRNGLHVLMGLVIIFSIFYAWYTYQRRDIISFDKLKAEITIEKCQNFIDKYPHSEKISEVRDWINKQYENELRAANDSLSLSLFIDKYSSNYRFKEEYKHPYLNKAIKQLDEEKKRLEYERNEQIRREQVAWNSEDRAWQTASERGMLVMFQRYLNLYPNGVHRSEAMKKIIDLEVADVFRSGNYGQLPSMDKIGYGKSAYTTVTVKNDTQYTLTLLYSGTESKRIVISSYDSQGVQLKSGSYRIVASVDASRVRNFAGKEDLTGGIYSVNYYISTSRY